MSDFTLTDLIDLEAIQAMQDTFSKYTGLGVIATNKDGKPVTRPSNFIYLCSSLVRKTSLGNSRCAHCDHDGAILSLTNKKAEIYTCHAGLLEIAAPIMIDGEYAGSLVAGQVRPPVLNKEKLRQTAEELKLDPEIFIQEAESAKVKTIEEMQDAAISLSEMAKAISNSAWKNLKILEKNQKTEKKARSQFLYVTQMTKNLKKGMDSWYGMLAQASESQDLPKIKENLKDIITKSTELYSIVEDSVNYFQLTEDKVELDEGTYEIRKNFEGLMNAVRGIPSYKQMKFNLSFSPAVPQFLFGDASRIGQAVLRLLFDLIHDAVNSEFTVFVDAVKEDYATMLEIHVFEPGKFLPDNERLKLTQYLEVGAASISDTKIISGMGLPFISMMTKHMSGTLQISNTATATEFLVRIPQLNAGEKK